MKIPRAILAGFALIAATIAFAGFADRALAETHQVGTYAIASGGRCMGGGSGGSQPRCPPAVHLALLDWQRSQHTNEAPLWPTIKNITQ